MGDTWGDGASDEKPTHRVELTYDFYVGTRFELWKKDTGSRTEEGERARTTS